MAMRILRSAIVPVLLVIAACKGKAEPKAAEAAKPAEPAKPEPAKPAPAEAAPASANCKPLPALGEGEQKTEDLDLDGDGTKDVAIGPEPSDCGSEDCGYALFLKRGSCYEAVGNVDHIPELATTKHNGLFDVTISVKGDTMTYTFDGTKYVGK